MVLSKLNIFFEAESIAVMHDVSNVYGSGLYYALDLRFATSTSVTCA